ncbi:MAG: hypothetical protein C5B52_10480 [Bacteroidetes bacterium]|nr:MAG: hypothetical protein C5B52_10480 [Bacteroidota bacterium]
MKRILLFVPLILLAFNNIWANNETGKPKSALTADFSASVTSGCIPLATVFTDNSTFNVGDPIVNWTWDFGDGSPIVTGVQNPSHTFINDGTWDVKLTVTTASNATATITKTGYISSGAKYTPDLGPDFSICDGSNALLMDNSGYTNDFEYTWYDGSGNVIFTGTMYVFVNTADTYTAEINHLGCIGTDQIVISSSPPLTVDWNYTVLANCTNVQVQFNDLSTFCGGGGGGASYTWFFNDGSPPDNTQNPIHTFTTGGSHTIQLSVDDGMGNADSKVVTINLPNPSGTPTVDLGPDQHLCNGSSIQLDANNEPGATYSWSPATGLDDPTIYNPTASPTTTTTYTVTKVKCGVTVTDNIQIIVDPAITMDFVADKTSGCAPLAVTFTDNSFSCADFITSWSWDFGDGNTSTLSQPTHTYAAAGNYTVSLTVTSMGGATATLSKPNFITVNSAPVVNLGNDTALCIGSTLVLDAGNPGATYLWNPGGATTQTLTVTGFVPTVYTVQVTKGGCTASDNIKVDLKPSVTPDFSSLVVSTCTPIGVQFTDMSTVCTGSITGWSWDFGDGNTSTAQNPLHNYAAGGTYTVSLTVTPSSGLPSTTSKSITISGGTGISVNLGNDTAICLGTSITLDAGNTGSTFLWSTGATTQTISVSLPGKYYVDVTNGTCSGSDTINVTIKPAAVVDFSTSVVSPCGPISIQFTDATTVCTGSISSWSWDFGDGNTSTSQNPLHNYAATGTYNVTLTIVTSTGVTSSTTKPVTVTGGSLTVDLGPDQTVCSGSSVTLDAGISGATYLWSTGATTQTISVNTTGSYSVTVTQGGCTGSDAVNVTVNPLPTVDLGPDATICSGNNLTLDAGNPGATYLWSTGATTQTISVNTPGTYSVTVTFGGCSASDAINVTVNPSPTVNLGPDKSICLGSSTILDAGNVGATYLWSTGATTQTISVNTAGSYSVTVTAGGCSASDAINIGVIPPPVVNLGPDATICAGSSMTLDAGNPGATYLWSTGATTRTIVVNTAGTYSVTVTAGGCSASDGIDISVNPGPTVNLGADQTVCSGTPVILDAGNAGATYLWSTGATTQTISVNTTGTYSVTVTAGGCSASDNVNVTVNPTPVVDLGPDATICSGSTVVLDAGNAGATYLWSTGATTQTISVNTAGTYSVTVTKGGCSASDAINITVGSAIVVDLGPDATICAGSNITLDAGNVGATYLWNTGATTRTITVSSAGTYSVTVTQGTCSASDAINITTKPAPTVNLGPDATICAGSNITLDAGNAGATYLWSTGATTQTIVVSTAGTYSVTVTAGGCSASDAIDIAVNPPPVVNLGPDATICSGTNITLDAGNAGATYLWSTGATTQTITVNTAGSYSVTVTKGGCSASDAINISVNPSPNVNLGPDATICVGNSITLDAGNAGATYLWSTGATTQTISVNTAGTYSVTVTAGGCSSTDAINVAVNPAPIVNLGPDASICSGSSVTLDAGNPGATYLWSTGATTQTISVNTAGTYSVTVTKGGCSASDAIDITTNTPPTVMLGPDVSICAGSTATLDAGNPGATYLWSNGATTQKITVSTAGTYSVTVTKNGCTGSDAINITVKPLPVVNLGPDASVCTSTSLTLDAGNPGAAYLWNTGATTQTISVNTAGTYSVQVTKFGCTGSDAINITTTAGPVVNLGPDATICSGTSTTLDAGNPGATYLWSTGATTQTISVNTTGTYSVTVTKNGCTATDAINITVGSALVVNLGNDTAICLGSSIVLDAGNAGSTYLWSPGGATTQTLTVTGFAPTVYTVTVTNGGCTGTDNIKVDLKAASTPQFTYVVTPTCAPVSVQFTDASTVCTGTITGWLWDFGDGNTSTVQNPNHSYATPGTYTVSLTITPSSGLPTTTTNSVIVNGGGITVNLGNDTAICLGNTLTLNAGNAGSTYLWKSGATTQTITVLFPGKYWVDVTNGGCSGSDTIVVSVKPPLAVNFGIDSSLANCTPADIKFTDSSKVSCGQTISSWAWDFGDGNTSSQQSPTHTYSAAGSYTVQLTVTTNTGISTSLTKSVNITSKPIVVNLGPDTTICRGNSVQLDAGNPGATFAWSPSSGLSATDIQNPVATPFNTTSYIVSVTNCSVTTNDTITINVNNVSGPTITQQGNELISSDASSYQWYKDGQLIPGATGKIYKPKGYGTYKVDGGSSTGCGGMSNPYFYLSDIGYYLGDIRCKISPTPAHGQVYLIFSKLPVNPVKVTVYDRVGRKLFITNAVNNVTELHMTNYAKGQYWVECVLDDKRTILPLITQ